MGLITVYIHIYKLFNQLLNTYWVHGTVPVLWKIQNKRKEKIIIDLKGLEL